MPAFEMKGGAGVKCYARMSQGEPEKLGPPLEPQAGRPTANGDADGSAVVFAGITYARELGRQPVEPRNTFSKAAEARTFFSTGVFSTGN